MFLKLYAKFCSLESKYNNTMRFLTGSISVVVSHSGLVSQRSGVRISVGKFLNLLISLISQLGKNRKFLRTKSLKRLNQMNMYIFTTRICGKVMLSYCLCICVCLCVCLSVQAITFECLGIETSLLVW